jgi:hypothetical protein
MIHMGTIDQGFTVFTLLTVCLILCTDPYTLSNVLKIKYNLILGN